MTPKTLKRPRNPDADHDLENVAPDTKAPKKSSNGNIRDFFPSKSVTNPPKTKVPIKVPAFATIANTPSGQAKAKPKPKHKSTTKTPNPQKVYDAVIAKAEKVHAGLERQCKKQDINQPDITSDHFAHVIVGFIPDVEALLDMGEDGRKCAFNLMLHLGSCVNGDMERYGSKMSGYGPSKRQYRMLDEVMLRVIEKRNEGGDVDGAKSSGAATEEIPRRWTAEDACVGPYKTGRPNKQQRGWLAGHNAEWKVDRRAKLRARREGAGDWLTSALEELLEQKKYLEDYGLNGYFEESIKTLEELKAGNA